MNYETDNRLVFRSATKVAATEEFVEFDPDTLKPCLLVWHLVCALQTGLGFPYYLISPAQFSELLAGGYQPVQFRIQLPDGLRSHAWIDLPGRSARQLHCLDNPACKADL